MTKRMLIDAAHPEQTRVAIVDGNRVEEFDFESQSKKQLRGNIYLAKITRVEPSLQAAFVDYGGNRHGFLAFNEIHPDYYQIPVEDRAKLLAAEAAEAAIESEADELEATDEVIDEDAEHDNTAQDASTVEEEEIAQEAIKQREKRRHKNYRRYKIQEVIKHGQIMLIQVVKEERGTKGAALTTYMSLAGRYCVLMPNTAKGGGISRKISNAADRSRLKSITSELEIAPGMGLIIRTAGSKRNKTEIKRDYDYLSRLWGTIRDNTLKSTAPSLVHEEGGLVRRAVRDLYDKDIESVLVEGEVAFKEAKEFMTLLMPSHASNVIHYQEKYPIFLRYQVEDQLETIHSPEVQLKSGGYLVIHQTEALVAIDVNSGRATRERNIETTAVKTNLEAADEACRQMRLRDLAGLIVIDFIDMEENKNNRAVEKRMKDALKRDRARVQAGRISMFGLFEMSRQRRRASVIEGTSQTCPTCNGLGVVRSIESSALTALQALESEGMRKRAKSIKLTAPSAVALYILNEKRTQVAEIEAQASMRVIVEADPNMHPPMHEIEVLDMLPNGGKSETTSAKEPSNRKGRASRKPKKTPDQPASDKPAATPDETDSAETPKRRRRGRRGGRARGKPDADQIAATGIEPEVTSNETPNTSSDVSPIIAKAGTDEPGPKRRVRRKRKSANADDETQITPQAASTDKVAAETAQPSDKPTRPKRIRRSKRPETSPPVLVVENTAEETPSPSKPSRRVRKRATTAEKPNAPSKVTPSEAPSVDPTPAKPTRRVRKRPTKETSVTAETPKKPTKKPATRKATPKAKPATKAPTPSARKVRTRKKPVAEVAVKPAAKPKKATPKPAAAVEAVKSEVTSKKTKRSWASRIFGDGETE
ncbi:MAG: Rne/Rng family ribonuclease [Robiginitomaculum sp.]|nr:Rne/Rng family ribonuclease [Robiginitomaculum sp.]